MGIFSRRLNMRSEKVRVDPDFMKEMKEMADIRLKNNLAKNKPYEKSIREMTSLLRRTDGYKISLEELKIKPKNQERSKMNKKGNAMGIIIFFVGLATVLGLGFVLAIGSGLFNLVFDEVTPVFTDLGVAGSINFTDIAESTIVPVNNIVQSFTWFSGVIYVVFLLAILGSAVILARDEMNPLWIGFFFLLAIILIIASIYMSNIYEDFYNDNGDIGDRLKEQKLLSFLVLYSPRILTILVFISGIIMFSRIGTDQGGAL